MKKNLLMVLIVLGGGFLFTGCVSGGSDGKESKRVEQQQNVYVDSQQVPFFDWSLERHLMIKLYEARNDAVITYSYARSLNGDIIFECQSMGFPLSADNQLTNPEKVARTKNGIMVEATMPQPEPNGLFSGSVNRGTYVFCINGDGTVSPSYFEQDVEVHMAPLNGRRTGGNPSLRINTQRE